MHTYEYAVLRVVPRAQREESMNAGVLLWCRALEALQARVHLDVVRLHALDPHADTDAVSHALAAVLEVCAGVGAAGAEPAGGRFRWLTAPRSTVLRPGPVHTGMTQDPVAEVERLLEVLVR